MKYRIIETYTATNHKPHWDAIEDTDAECSFGAEYIDHILGEHTDCRWECEDEKGAPMVQLFLRSDSECFHKSALDALASVPV